MSENLFKKGETPVQVKKTRLNSCHGYSNDFLEVFTVKVSHESSFLDIGYVLGKTCY
jgi:hypothetical protein